MGKGVIHSQRTIQKERGMLSYDPNADLCHRAAGRGCHAFLLAFVLTALTDSIFRDKLPHDHGRAFAVNGELSKGKARGSGLIFVLCIALVSLAFLPSTQSMWCTMCC